MTLPLPWAERIFSSAATRPREKTWPASTRWWPRARPTKSTPRSVPGLRAAARADAPASAHRRTAAARVEAPARRRLLLSTDCGALPRSSLSPSSRPSPSTAPIRSSSSRHDVYRTDTQQGQKYLPRLLEHGVHGELDPSFLATHRFSLEDTLKGYELFKKKLDGGVRAVFLPN